MRIEMILKTLFVVVFLALLVLIGLVLTNSKSTIYNQPEEVVQVYLNVIQAGDVEALKRIVSPSRSDAHLDIDQKLRSYGGLRLDNIKITYNPTESPFFVSAILQADGIKANGERVLVEDKLELRNEQYDPIRLPFIQPRYSWFLLLGRSMENPVNQQPARTP